MARRTLPHLLIVALLCAGALPVAWAARLQHARPRRLKVCIGLIPSMGERLANPPTPEATWSAAAPDPDAIIPGRSPNPRPYLFYVLDQRKDLKPDGWEFVNPAAPQAVTLAQSLRWASVTGRPNALPQGTALRQDMGAYWEVPLNERNFGRLVEMDLIYIPITRRFVAGVFVNFTYFTEEQRRLLARLADAGVSIWVDWAAETRTLDSALGGANLNLKNPFFTNLDFAAAETTAFPPGAGHPLLEAVFNITGDAMSLGRAYRNSRIPNRPDVDRALNLRPLGVQPTANFAAVVPTGGIVGAAAYVAAARFGAGYVIGTAGDVGGAIASMFPANAVRAGDVAGADIGRAEPEDLKFAYNVFGWITEVTAQGKNARHTGQSGVQINGMIERSVYPQMIPPAPPNALWQQYPPIGANPNNLPVNPAPALLINDLVIAPTRFLTGGGLASELNVFEARPERDFDRNGYLDDPLTAASPANHPFADMSIGLSYDRTMGLSVPTIFGMTVGEVPAAGSQRSKAFVFASGVSEGAFTGLYALPAPRAGLPPDDFWNLAGVAKQAPTGVRIDYTGAPAFVNVPGPFDPASTRFTDVQSILLGGGIDANAAGGTTNPVGKIVAFNVEPEAGGNLFFNDGGVNPDGSANRQARPMWYYPPDVEANRMGAVSGPLTTAQVVDTATGTVDTMVLVTSHSSGDPNAAQQGNAAGDTTGKVEGFIIATRGDVLSFPRGNMLPGASNPNAGRRFVSARWLDIPPGTGQVPQPSELIWDPTKHYEVRVMDKGRNYVLLRYIRGTTGFNLLKDGTAGQVELPVPPTGFSAPGRQDTWDLSRFVLLADYSPLPQSVDQNGATIRPRFLPATPYERDVDNTRNVVQPTGIAGGVTVGKDGLVYYGTGLGFMCAAEWRRGHTAFRWKMRSMEYQPETGQLRSRDDIDPTKPAYLQDYAFAAAPAAGDRVVFASSRPSGPNTVYVLEPDAVIRFPLSPSYTDETLSFQSTGARRPWTTARALDVVLQADHGIAVPQNNRGIMATQQPWGRVPNQFSVDPDTGVVTFLNMENFSLDLRSALSPAYLLSRGIDTGGRPAVTIRWWFRTNTGNPDDPSATSPAVAVIPLPLVAVYQTPVPTAPGVAAQPERWLSSPVISGDRIYLMGGSGFLHELPLDPTRLDPAFPRLRDSAGSFIVTPPGNLSVLNLANTSLYGPDGLRRTREVFYDAARRVMAPPAIAEGIVVCSTPRGLAVFDSPNVVVADSNRVVEASGDSLAFAATDVVSKDRFDDSDFPIPTDPSLAFNPQGRAILAERKLLNRPAMVQKLNASSSLTTLFMSSSVADPDPESATGIKEKPDYQEESYLAADTGNNRCVEFNPTGKVVWELSEFQDPFGLLPPGESRRLSGPMSVQRWVEVEPRPGFPPDNKLYVIHTLVADTGNTRVIEIVDKVYYQNGIFNHLSYPTVPGQVGADGTPIRWYHVLVWTSQTNAQGLRLRYRNAQRIYWTRADGTLIPTGAPRDPTPDSFWVPEEPYLSYTMAAVTGQEVVYPDATGSPSVVNGYHRFYPAPSREVEERRPLVRSGGDSILFLRGRWLIDDASPVTPVRSPLREARVGVSAGGDTYRFSMGAVDPNVPILGSIGDELDTDDTPASDAIVHQLRGVNSVHRTVRADVKFAPRSYAAAPNSPMRRYPYFLVADADGVWEMRLLPGDGTPYSRWRPFLAWAFTNEDYAYVTGAGNGAPSNVFSPSPADHEPGGRLLAAWSARWMPNGTVLITSRKPENSQPPVNLAEPDRYRLLAAGADVFLLKLSDYFTASERVQLGGSAQWDRTRIGEHGWRPDPWVQAKYAGNIPNLLKGASSIRWRAAEQFLRYRQPTLQTQLQSGSDPLELFGTYIPAQPAFADLVY